MKAMLRVLNPNRTAWMTERVVQQVQALAGAQVVVRGVTARDGPEVIADASSFEAGGMAARQVLQTALADARDVTAGVLLACFGDPALEALRAAAGGIPVRGMAECAIAAAAGARFAILTAGPAWVPLLQQRAADFGHAQQLVGVWALPVDGRQFATAPARWLPALRQAADEALERGAQHLILGGAGFAGLQVLDDHPLPRIDPLAAATAALLHDMTQARA